MTAHELVARIRAGTPPFLLDVRSGWEYRRGHVPGATHLPFWTLLARIHEIPVTKAEPIVVYCGHGPSAWMARAVLKQQGFTDVVYLDGHMHTWYAAGHPVETTAG